jgi:hypothetical protein
LKILNRCVFIPLPINQVTWQLFSSFALGERGGQIPLWEGDDTYREVQKRKEERV